MPRTNGLSFSVEGSTCQVFDIQGTTEKVYVMDVLFGHGKAVNLSVQARTLEAALVIIESLGRQYKNMTIDEFTAYKEKKYGQVLIVDHKETAGIGDSITFYKKPHRLRGNEGLDFAFYQKKVGLEKHLKLSGYPANCQPTNFQGALGQNERKASFSLDPNTKIASDANGQQIRLGISQTVHLDLGTLRKINAYAMNIRCNMHVDIRPASATIQLVPAPIQRVDLQLQPIDYSHLHLPPVDEDIPAFSTNSSSSSLSRQSSSIQIKENKSLKIQKMHDSFDFNNKTYENLCWLNSALHFLFQGEIKKTLINYYDQTVNPDPVVKALVELIIKLQESGNEVPKQEYVNLINAIKTLNGYAGAGTDQLDPSNFINHVLGEIKFCSIIGSYKVKNGSKTQKLEKTAIQMAAINPVTTDANKGNVLVL